MTDTEARWSSALAEHEEVVSDFCRLATTFDSVAWRTPPRAGKWSPAAVSVVPDLAGAETSTPASLVERLRQSSQVAADSLRRANIHRPGVRIAHAYFGSLTPLLALRLLSTHTRHHARALAGEDAVYLAEGSQIRPRFEERAAAKRGGSGA